MLKDATYNATIPAQDLERAKRFYADKLGLTPSEDPGGAGLFYGGGEHTRFLLFPSSGAASGAHTQLGFNVSDIDAEVAALKARGVTFEEYDFPGLKTVGGIADVGQGRAAWFKDSEGNLLGIIQRAG